MVNFLNFMTFDFSWTPDMQCGALLRASLVVLFSAYLTLWSGYSDVKNLPASEDPGSIPRSGRSEKGMDTLSSILAWRIPWREDSYSPQGRKESDTTEQLCTHTHEVDSEVDLLALLYFCFTNEEICPDR